MDQSRIFLLNGVEHEYEEKDPIYFRSEPTTKNSPLEACKSCNTRFESYKSMNYCQFCSFANCKSCL
jgi:hypothetical protein